MPQDPWSTHTVGRCLSWHAIISFRQDTRSDDVERIIALRQYTASNYIGLGITTFPLDSTHGLATSGLECPLLPWTSHTVVRRRAWHCINALGLHTRSDYIRHGMPACLLGSTHGQTTSMWNAIISFVVHTRMNDIGRGMPSSPLCRMHDQTMSGFIAFVKHTRSDYVRRGVSYSIMVIAFVLI